MFGLPNLQTILVTALIAAVAGFGAGYYTKNQFDKAAQIVSTAHARKETAANVLQSVKKDQSIDAAIESSSSGVDAIRNAVAARLNPKPQPQPQEASVHESSAIPQARNCPDRTLDAGTVGLLNDARTGSFTNPAGLGLGQVEAAAAASGSPQGN